MYIHMYVYKEREGEGDVDNTWRSHWRAAASRAPCFPARVGHVCPART